jgi:hypothetical protein
MEKIVERRVEVECERIVDRVVEIEQDVIVEKIVEIEVDEEIVEVPVQAPGEVDCIRRITLAEQGYLPPTMPERVIASPSVMRTGAIGGAYGGSSVSRYGQAGGPAGSYGTYASQGASFGGQPGPSYGAPPTSYGGAGASYTGPTYGGSGGTPTRVDGGAAQNQGAQQPSSRVDEIRSRIAARRANV